jgi:hypothetical protein
MAERAYLAKHADISPCGLYRYRLGRTWGGGPTALFVMLNPSIADGTIDDPTIVRCVGFAEREGCGALDVVNLFAWISTDPKALASTVHPVGPMNDEVIRVAAARASLIVCAWGASIPRGSEKRVGEVLALLPIGRPAKCFGTTASGAPRHPLYLPAGEPLVPYVKTRGPIDPIAAGQTP